MRASYLLLVVLEAKRLLDERPVLGRRWIRIGPHGLVAQLPGFEKSISWEAIERIETRRVLGIKSMLVLYLKRPDRPAWLHWLERLNRGPLPPAPAIGGLFSDADVQHMQRFIDAHYAKQMQRTTVSESPSTQEA